MATELGKAYVQIMPSAKGLSGSISNVMDGEAISAGKTSGHSFAGAFKKIVIAAGIGMALKKVIGDAFANGGELQQNLGGTEAVFGNFADNIQKKAEKAYKNMGMSASEYMATANKMGSLFQGSGIEQQKALDMTSAAMQRAADVASVMGIDMSMAMESIAGAAKGNFTMMDNLGVAMNATTLQAYALEKGINFEWRTASNAQKAELAMQMFMERTSQYAGNFAKESEGTWTGSMGAMKAAYKDLMANLMLGKDLSPSLSNLGETVKVFFSQNLMPALKNILSELPGMTLSLITDLGPAIFIAAGDLLMQLGQGIIAGIPTLQMSWDTMLLNFKTFMQTKFPEIMQNGTEIVNNLISGVIQGFPSFQEEGNKIMSGFVQTVSDSLPTILESGVQIITNLLNGILQEGPKILENAGALAMDFLDAIIDSLPSILDAGKNMILSLLNGLIENGPEIIIQIGKTMIDFIYKIKSALPGIAQKGIEIIGELLAGLIEAAPKLPAKAVKIIFELGQAFLDKDWAQIGKDMIKGIASGVKKAAKKVVDAAVNVAKDAIKSVKKWLGIKSPSRRMRDEVGLFMAEGLGIGFEQNIPIHSMTESVRKSVRALKERASAMTLSPFDVNARLSYAGIGSLDGYVLVEQQQIDYERIGRETAKAVEGLGVYMDSRPVGKVIAKEVDAELGRIERRRS